jgi:pimeloyl-ACP methyl ester carboxylesterase
MHDGSLLGHRCLRGRTVPHSVARGVNVSDDPVPATGYVRTPDGAYLAVQTCGTGPADVVVDFNPDEGNVDLIWEEPDWRPLLTGIAGFARLILHDRRGTGASSRNVPPPNLETRVADLLIVLDALGVRRPVLVAGTEPGAMHALFAATHPDRVQGLL